MMQQLSLPILTSLRIYVTVGHEEIGPTVVVVVKEFCAPPYIRQTHLGNFRLEGHVTKRIAAVVVIENVVLVVEVGYEEIKSSVMIVITQGHSHATLLATALIHCGA